jgi:hypothetical protein
MKPEQKEAGGTPAVQTIELGGRQVRVRKWPIRRAFTMTQRAMQAFAPLLASADLENLTDPGALVKDLSAQLSDENASLAVEMIDCALDMPPGGERTALAEEAGLEDLAVVLERNLVFPLGRLKAWWRSSKTSTTPAPASPDSESPSLKP